MTDKEIIYLYNNGHRELAFNLIVKNYSERIYHHIRRFVYSHDDADDLTQEVFIKIWAALPSYRGGRAAFYVDIPNCHESSAELFAQTEVTYILLTRFNRFGTREKA